MLDGQTIVNYYGQLRTIWGELNNYDKIPLCSCGGCICNLTTELENTREEEKVHLFLIGLDEEHYGIVHANILSTDSLPNLYRVYAMVVQQERVRTMLADEIQGGQNCVCSHCNREGHDSGTCFQLIGYPDWWGNRPYSSAIGRGSGRKCNSSGRRNKCGVPRANVTQTFATESSHRGVIESGKKGLSGLNDEK
ncbi:retrovirus-related Pol polyprotein from transposon TNT 1-94 isoform X1 [Gossypium australe]|uniref:Retrovirus-related Pol polyprotein from transposon TNT 1-94 isoform X1 n=1 Tax=Gossypium australe TaxID=47621 RepID=A0A5B6VCP4_9ROSI|nr:retrovirus-related Pol polyprotein from transposon TNT 1-94 isoform X1 [Gossypium australe]